MRFAGLDALRLIAAALVLLAHGAFFLYPLLPNYDLWLGLGWIGTEVFFALSGFLLIRALLADRRQSPAAAVRVRLLRVMPLFWVFVAINLGLWGWQHATLPERWWSYPPLLQNSWAMHPAFFGEAWNLPPLVFFWLLMVPLAGRAASHPDPRKYLRNALLGLALIGLALRLVLVHVLDPSWDVGVRKWLPMRLDACVWGGVLACWQARKSSSGKHTSWVVSGLALVLLSLVLFVCLPRDSSLLARSALFSMIGLGCALPLPWLCRGVSTAALGNLAGAVFALYLVNMPLIQLAAMFDVSAIGALPAFALWLLTSMACAWLLASALARSRLFRQRLVG
ncbi:MAG: acyltransferase family protein [Pseudomarimonas sp.]